MSWLTMARGSRISSGQLPGRGAVEPPRLILDLDGDLRQGARVLPVVVRAEEQLQAAGQQHPYVSLSAATVATVHGGQIPSAGLSPGRSHVLASVSPGPA